MGVADVTLPTVIGAELQQVDHHDGFVGRPRSERGELLRGGPQGRTHVCTRPLTLIRRRTPSESSPHRSFVVRDNYWPAAGPAAVMSIVAQIDVTDDLSVPSYICW